MTQTHTTAHHTNIQIPKVSLLNFSQALDALKLGAKVSRQGWNGKKMWLKLVTSWSANLGQLPADYECLPWLAMKTADDKVVPWLASQTDLLACDWSVVVVSVPEQAPKVTLQ